MLQGRYAYVTRSLRLQVATLTSRFAYKVATLTRSLRLQGRFAYKVASLIQAHK